jgi:tetratricopeptide (TPR) repeat protein
MSEDYQWSSDKRDAFLAERFERMLNEGDNAYFDAEEFEAIIEHYQDHFDSQHIRLAIEHAIRQHPDNVQLRIRYARQLAIDNRFIEALEILNKLEVTEPNDVDVIMTKGTVYSMMLEFKKAVNTYKLALPLVDEDELEEVYATIGYEYENLGNYDQSIRYFRKALEINPGAEPLLFELGLCYELIKKPEEGIQYFQEFINNRDPYSIPAWFNMGLIYQQMDLFEKSIDALEYVLAIDDTYVPAYLSIAHAYSNLADYNKAIEVYKETFAFEKPDGMTLYYIGECYEKMRDYKNALTHYNNALELDDKLAEPWAGIGVIFDDEGNTKTAVKYLSKAIELDPLNAEYFLIQADMYIKMKHFEKAEACYRTVETFDPNDQDLWLEYSNLFIIKNDYERAIQVLRTGLTHQPENADIHYRLAVAYYLNNNLIQSSFFLSSGLELNFEGHFEMLRYYPDIIKSDLITDLISQYVTGRKSE